MTAAGALVSRSLLLAALVLCAHASAHARQAQGHASAPLLFHLTVTDSKGRLIGGVRRESLTAVEGGERREIVSFAADDAPASVMFLVDTSYSAFGREGGSARLAALKASLSAFLERANPSNEYLVTAFNQRPHVLLEGSREAAAVLAACDRLGSAELGGQTAMNDALYLSLDKLASRPARKRVLVLLSDGQDNMSNHLLADVRRKLRESDVIFYLVRTREPRFRNEQPTREWQIRLEDLVASSGGAALFPLTAAEMKGALAQIADELRSQYEVSVAAAPRAKGGGRREVRFKLVSEPLDASGRKLKAVVRARPAFYEAGAPRGR